MNIIVATSRGRGLAELEKKRDDVVLSVHPGAKLTRLEQEAISLLQNLASSCPKPKVYFVAGLPDVTQKVKRHFYLRGKRQYYEEVILPKIDTNQIITDVTTRLYSVADNILKLNATPIFSTICPMSIATWNNVRLSQHKTAYLSSFHDYPEMQSKQETVIAELNRIIHTLNRSINVHTPRLCNTVMYRRKGHLRCRYGKLSDGVHASKKLSDTWIDIIDNILNLNNNIPELSLSCLPPLPPSTDTDESEDDECISKRSWLY